MGEQVTNSVESETPSSAEATTTTTSSEPTTTKTKQMKKAKKPTAKKTTKKAAKKTPKVKAAKKKPAKKPRKTGEVRRLKVGKLLKMHARILQVLDGSKDSLTVVEVAAKAGTQPGITTQYLGCVDPKKRKQFEDKYLHYPTLLTEGYVVNVPGKPRKKPDGTYSESLGPVEFKITAAGRKMIRSADGKEVLASLKEKKPYKIEVKAKKAKVAKKKKAA